MSEKSSSIVIFRCYCGAFSQKLSIAIIPSLACSRIDYRETRAAAESTDEFTARG